MAAPSSLPRQMPVKETTAPMSRRPSVRPAISRETSKSHSWIQMVTLAVMTTPASTAGHRREEGDFAGAGNRRILFDVGVVNRGTNHARRIESMSIALAARGKPCDQIFDGLDARGRLDRLFGLADPFAHPGEIFQLHPSSSLMR